MKKEEQCKCMIPSLRTADFSIVQIGTDETNGRFGDVSIATCKTCGQQWLCYQLEYEAFSRSGRWYRGAISPDDAEAMKPEAAVTAIVKMDWYFAGGSYFNSTGLKMSGTPSVDP